MADFIGAKNLFFWKVTEDSEENYTAETPKRLSRIAEISQTTEQAQNVVYYDNVAAYAVNSKGGTTITATVEALALEILAELHGTTIDADTGALIDSGEAKNLSFGIAFQADYVGEEGSRYYSFPKVTISIPDESSKTKDAGTDTLNQSLTITAVSTIHKFTTTGEACKLVVSDTPNGNEKIDFTKWFEQAITPDALETIKKTA